MNHRIVSLLPAATEVVWALGCEEGLVGRSHECDFPPTALSRPVCSRSRIDVSGGSLEIDSNVKQALSDGLSLFEVDVNLLRTLQPTLILTQAQCEVCAVSLANVEEALAELVMSRPRVVSLTPHCLKDVWADVRRVAAVLDRPEQAESLIRKWSSRLDLIQMQTDDSSTSVKQKLVRPSVACVEWIDPLMTAGNWVPELVEIAGGQNVLSEPARHSPWLEWSDLIVADPDVLVFMPCGWGIAQARRELDTLLLRPEWSSLQAVRTGQVFVADGHHYFNRPGPRLVESTEILAEILYPNQMHFGHKGHGWQRLMAH
jgi:iron complex transport system substrate-binding protein